MADLSVLPIPTTACRMAQASAEKLEHTGPAEKERVASVPQRKQLARTPELPLPKGNGTEPSVQSTRSCGRRESQGGREPHLGEGERDQSGSLKKERVDSTVKESRF